MLCGEGTELSGTASYLGIARGILDGSVDRDKVQFSAEVQVVLGDETRTQELHYQGQLQPGSFTLELQTQGGFSSEPPISLTSKTR